MPGVIPLFDPASLPGSVRRRSEVQGAAAYAVFDCETTGTDPAADEIVSLAVLRLTPTEPRPPGTFSS